MRQSPVTFLFTLCLLLASGVAISAQTLRIVHPFTNWIYGPDGAQPTSGLVLSGNTLYGNTSAGGNGAGIMFSVNTDGGEYSILHTNTDSADNLQPSPFLIVGDELFATSQQGGSNFEGTVFEMTLTGSEVPLHVFGYEGSAPVAGLMLAGDKLYGTTMFGGSNNSGTIFAIATNSSDFSVIYNFSEPEYYSATNFDGDAPTAALVSLGKTLYGTASNGGTSAEGTIFSIQTDGSGFTTLHSFTGGAGGASPRARLTVVGDQLFGTTILGGTNGAGTVFCIKTNGTGFTVLHSFARLNGSGWDGAHPQTGLLLVGDMLYGVTPDGGLYGGGTIYALSTNGSSFITLHHFSGLSDGVGSQCDLTYSRGAFYGTLFQGPSAWPGGCVFALMMQPTIRNFAFSSGGVSMLASPCLAGQSYVLLTTTNMASPLNNWTPIVTNVPTSTGDLLITATNGTRSLSGARCFRLLVE